MRVLFVCVYLRAHVHECEVTAFVYKCWAMQKKGKYTLASAWLLGYVTEW